MYFPIFRGRQFELLALREMLEKDILSSNIVPVVEPVKVSFGFIKMLNAFINKKHRVVIIRNPQVGFWSDELEYESNKDIRESILSMLQSEFVNIAWYIHEGVENRFQDGRDILILNKEESISVYDKVLKKVNPIYCLIPDKSVFRRKVREHRVLLEDHFRKQNKNADYKENEDEFFSADHLYYVDDGYEGFSDYSVIGAEYSDSGFAPHAVAIHIVYPEDNGELRIRHFVSDSNDNYNDPAGKFYEALTKLINWNEEHKIVTHGLNFFRKCYDNGDYPGLGVIKKYSIMHHLETIGSLIERNDSL